MPIIFYLSIPFIFGIACSSFLTFGQALWIFIPFLLASVILSVNKSFAANVKGKLCAATIAFAIGLVPLCVYENIDEAFRLDFSDRCLMYGTISDINKAEGKALRLTFTLDKISNLKEEPIKSNRKVYIYSDDSAFSDAIPGQKAIIGGTLNYPEPAMNFGGFNLRRYYSSLNIIGVCNNPDLVKIYSSSFSFKRILYEITHFSKATLNRFVGGESADFVTAVLLGDRSGFSENLTENSRKVGISHVTAVSGMHVSILIALVLALSKPFTKRRDVKAKIVISVLLFYMVLSGLSPSVIRSTVMNCCFMSSIFTGKRTSPLLVLTLCASVMLAPNPFLLYNPSFMLSFISTIGLILFLPFFQEKAVSMPVSIFIMTVIANVVTMPYVLWNFDFYSWIGLFSNLLIVPLISTVFIGGFLTVVFGFFPFLACIAGVFTRGICSVILTITEFIGSLSFGRASIPLTGLFMVAAFYIFILMIYFILKRKTEHTFVTFVLAAFIMFTGTGIHLVQKQDFSVTQLYVGQGDSAVVQVPGGSIFLIDTGDITSTGKSDCLDYLQRNGIRKIRGIILSHEDSDHSGALETIVDALSVENIYISRGSMQSRDQSEIIRIASKSNSGLIPVKNGDTLYAGDVTFNFFCPDEYSPSSNNGSLVTRLSYKNRHFLFTGDIDTYTENFLIPVVGKCHVLKVAHHGSANSTSENFLQAVNPSHAVISTGRDNKYSHPDSEVVARLKRNKIKTFVTSTTGGIRFYVSENGKIIAKTSMKQ